MNLIKKDMQEIKRIFLRYKIHFFLILCLILVISWITYHSDLFNVAKIAASVTKGDFSMTQKSGSGEVIYSSFFPPMFHFVDALFYYPFVKLGIYRFDLNHVPVNQLLSVGFLLKLRYLVVFILSVVVMLGVSRLYEKDERKRNKIFLLWLLCPVLIFLPFSWGNNDIYPTFLLLLFLFLSFKRKYFWAMVFLGLSAATKNFSLFLILPAALVLANKNPKKVFLYGLVASLVYLVPFLLYFKTSHTFVTGGDEGLFILQKKILDGPLFFPLAYFVTLLFLLIKEKVNDLNKNELLIKYCFLTLSLFYLASFFIPHWFLWIMPFFALSAYKNRKLFYLYILINCTFFVNIYAWSRNIDMNLFSVAFPIINKVMTLGEFVLKFLPNFKIFDIINSLFFAAFIFYIYLLFFDKNKNLPKESLSEKEINIFSVFPLILYLAISLTFVLGMVMLRNRDWYDLGLTSRREVIGPIYASGQFYQTFRSPKNRLIGINLFLSTYAKKIETPYKLILYDESCKFEILESEIKVDKIDDNAYREVLFNEIKDSKDKGYCFTVEPSIKQVDTPITLHYSKFNSYRFGELVINKQKLKNEDAVFQLVYPLR